MSDCVMHQAVVGSSNLPREEVAVLYRAALDRLIAAVHCSLTSTIGDVRIKVERDPFGEYVARAEATCGDPLCVELVAGSR
ncbi:hypothetical protein B6R96_36090 (plasmid) [Streptomyces sp. Sge12]|uniref:hypothetical protein n=1 Tax=Streptomyces TaxID=1883 RepID=UPI0004CCB867|nr:MULTISPECIES: hypothetical protein [Streptomyces]ARE79448.1 hypothetical protein B6R96_36090 [Streptomyces sp. Sge12]